MTETSAPTESWWARNSRLGAFLSSFSLSRGGGGSCKSTLVRRASMWAILILRIVISITVVAFQFFGTQVGFTVLGVILALLNTVFVAWCLSMIDRAEGYRNVCCIRVVHGFVFPPALLLLLFVFVWCVTDELMNTVSRHRADFTLT